MQDDSVRDLAKNLEDCINNNYKGKYVYDQESRTLTSNIVKKTLEVSEQQEYYMKEFLKDACGIIEIGKLIQKEKLPVFFTFHITSLGELEPLLKEQERRMAVDMLAKAIGKFRKSVGRHFDEDEISG